MAFLDMDHVIPPPDDERGGPFVTLVDLLVFGLLFVTPVLISTRSKHVFNGPKYMWVALMATCLAVAWLTSSLWRGELRLPRHPFFRWYALVVLWQFVTVSWSPARSLSLYEFGTQFALFVVALVVGSTVRSRERAENFIHVAMAAAMVVAGYGLLQYYELDQRIFGAVTTPWLNLSWLVLPKKPETLQKIYSLMGHRNYLAGYLICVLPLVVARLLSTLSVAVQPGPHRSFARRQSLVYGACMVLLFTTVVLTQTRGSWVGLSAGLAFFTVVTAWKFRCLDVSRAGAAIVAVLATVVVTFGSKSLTVGWLVAVVIAGTGLTALCLTWTNRAAALRRGAVVVVAALVVGAGLSHLFTAPTPLARMHDSALERLAHSFDLRHGSAFQRTLIWLTACRIITDGPWNFLCGTGMGTFGLYYMPYQAKILAEPAHAHYTSMVNKSVYAHSEYLHFWTETGLIGLLLLFAAAWSFFRSTAAYVARCDVDHQNLVFVGTVASIVAVLVHNIFSFSLHLPYTSSLFYCLVVFALAHPGGPLLRLRPAGTPVRTAVVELDGGWLGLGLRRLPDGALRSWVGWLARPAAPVVGDVAVGTAPAVPVPAPDGDDLVATVPQRKAQDTTTVVLRRHGAELAVVGPVGPATGPRSAVTFAALVVVAAAGALVCAALVDGFIAETEYRDGYLLFQRRDFLSSILRFEIALDYEPDRGELLFDYARVLMDSGRNDAAIRFFERSGASFVDPAAIFNISVCHFKQGRMDESMHWLRATLDLNPIFQQALVKLAGDLIRMNRVDEARPLVARALQYYPRDAQAVTTAGVLAGRDGNPTESRRLLAQAVKREPKLETPRFNLASDYYNEGEYLKAERIYEGLAAERPSAVLFVRGYLEARLARFRQQLQRNPDEPTYVKALGMTLAQAAKFDPSHLAPAVSMLRRYLVTQPTDVEARFYMGGALLLAGQFDESISQLEAALAQVPPNDPLRPDIEKTLVAARRRVVPTSGDDK